MEKSPNRLLAFAIGAVLSASLLTACGGGGSSTSYVASTIPGAGIDGYVSYATVFYDANNNQTLDAGEYHTTTDNLGNYSLQIALPQGQSTASGQLVLMGGTDIGTNKPFLGVMTARPDPTNPSTNITALTSLVNNMVTSGAATSATDAATKLGNALGVSATNISGDPVSLVGTEPGLLQKAVALQKAIEILASAEAGATGGLANATQRVTAAMAKNIATASANTSITNLVRSTSTSGLSNPTAVGYAQAAAAQMANTTEAVVASGVANLLGTGVSLAGKSNLDIANAVQQSVNPGVAGLADLQSAMITAVKTAPSSTVSSVASGLSNASSLNTLINNITAVSVVPTITSNNYSTSQQALANVASAVANIPVTLNIITVQAASLSVYYATTATSQTATGTNLVLPAGYTNMSVTNGDPADGAVLIQANNGTASSVINITVPVGVTADAHIYDVISYQSTTNSTITNATSSSTPVTSSATAYVAATTVATQTATSASIVLPKGYTNISVTNANMTDGVVDIQANDGAGNVIHITVPVGSTADAAIYDTNSYTTVTGGSITNSSI